MKKALPLRQCSFASSNCLVHSEVICNFVFFGYCCRLITPEKTEGTRSGLVVVHCVGDGWRGRSAAGAGRCGSISALRRRLIFSGVQPDYFGTVSDLNGSWT